MSAAPSRSRSPSPSPAQLSRGSIDRLVAALLERQRGHEASPRADLEIVGAGGGSAGRVLAQLRLALDRPLVIVVPDEARAQVIADGIAFFSGVRQGHPSRPDPAAVFPSLDHVPFQGMSPSRLQVMERVTALFRVRHPLGLDALIVPAPALLDRVIPAAALDAHAAFIATGDTVAREALIDLLVATGYHRVPAVEDPGTFAVRGGILDVFSPLMDAPARIELWGDEVDTIRLFDPVTQRTREAIERVALSPARDVIFTREAVRRARARIHELADHLLVPTSRVRALVDDLDAGILGVGMEDLLPLFHERLDTLFDVAWPEAIWLVEEPERCGQVMIERWEDVARRAERLAGQRGELALPAEALFMPAPEATQRLSERADARLLPLLIEDGAPPRRRFTFEARDNRDLRAGIAAAMRDGSEHVLGPLASRVHGWRRDGKAVVACAATAGGVERLFGLIRHYGVSVSRHPEPFSLDALEDLRRAPIDLHLFRGAPGQGFRDEALGLVLLDEAEILGAAPRRRARRRQAPPEQALQSWRDLHVGDHVVHLSHGIGRYLGLEKTIAGGIETDFLVLEYADSNKLFVPVEKLHLVAKHSPGDGEGATRLDKLGGTRWQRTHGRVRRAVRDIADQLVALYAIRAASPGYAFPPPDGYFHRFAASFPFEETPDQARAIDETLADMQRDTPMDRIVCGDVGFGKTEVALRAAFLAVLAGKQVAILVPTQVLAEQHRVTFARRLDGFPVTVEALSRMRSGKEQRDILRRLARGTVDIIIGTHRLLSKDVAFKDLGLLVIDEEHRFGVSHKERLKEMRAAVDVLTLTATPIPRTLHMAMMGLRDISLIQTPPTDRLPIRTPVAQPNDELIAEAIRRELARGGQVYYVHNRVEDIEQHAELIRRVVPEARVAVGHGQMPRGELEGIMARFVRGEATVLVCTTIIESGVDIANANTMLINRADRFGLAQLHQLRGRVGRSSARASCYLLVPAPQNLDGDAKERIAAIQRFSELGSGFSIANHDLDIRGAGDLLGADQSGNIDAVGYEAYMELLREAIEELRAEREGRPGAPRIDPELKIAVEGRIPEAWLPDTHLRLRLYRDLAGASSVEGVLEVLEDAIDRYGEAPVPVDNLANLMAIKLEARALGLRSVVYTEREVALTLSEESPLAPEGIAALIEAAAGRFAVTPDLRLSRPVSPGEWSAGLAPVRESLRWLSNFVSAHGTRNRVRGS